MTAYIQFLCRVTLENVIISKYTMCPETFINEIKLSNPSLLKILNKTISTLFLWDKKLNLNTKLLHTI